MALSAVSLAARIKAQLSGKPYVQANPDLDSFCLAIATAVVAEIQASAMVLPTALVAPTGGGPVTGTGTVI